MQSIDRVMKVVNVFISQDANRLLSISELARECQLPISSLHRILKSMIKHDMIQQDQEQKLYGLGVLWLEYGLKIYDTMDYISTLRPELENLMRNTHASVYLSKPMGNESIIIERIDCVDQTIRAHNKLGLRRPMTVGAENLVMLAYMPLDYVVEIINELVPVDDILLFEKRLKEIRYQGYYVSNDQQNNSISTVAVPLINRYNEVLGAVSIKLENSILTDYNFKTYLDKIVHTTNKISWKMNYNN